MARCACDWVLAIAVLVSLATFGVATVTAQPAGDPSPTDEAGNASSTGSAPAANVTHDPASANSSDAAGSIDDQGPANGSEALASARSPANASIPQVGLDEAGPGSDTRVPASDPTTSPTTSATTGTPTGAPGQGHDDSGAGIQGIQAALPSSGLALGGLATVMVLTFLAGLVLPRPRQRSQATPGTVEGPSLGQEDGTSGLHSARADPALEPTGRRLPPGAPKLLELAREAAADQRHQEAIGWLETAIAVKPQLPLAHLSLGLLLMTLERDEQALEALQAARRIGSPDASVLYHEARALARLGRRAEALDRLEPLIEAQPALLAKIQADPDLGPLADHPRLVLHTRQAPR